MAARVAGKILAGVTVVLMNIAAVMIMSVESGGPFLSGGNARQRGQRCGHALQREHQQQCDKR